MNAPIQIRRDDVVQDIRELAALTDKPITEAVAGAVRAELIRARAKGGIEARRQAVAEIVRQFREAPVVGPLLTDADFYDEDGMPK
jgi:antitoxin VapB